MSTNFLDPVYYDVNDIHPDAPNKPLLRELFERENAQNERLWEFFTEMTEDPQWKAMSSEAIKPRQHRKKRKKAKQPEKPRNIDDPESEEFMTGYKEFLKEEFGDS
tara:strand:- start:93 stop:410 length:318 start_codon:yes stop_codon:yes gene_type:complete